VLEGGSIITDGAGTLVTTEQCLLNPNRNPELNREEIEDQLEQQLGVTSVVWLGQGLIEDRDTDGHVDLIAALTPARQLLLQQVPEGNPNAHNCAENRRRAHQAGLQTIDLPFLPYVEVNGETVAASYLNFYTCNGAVIVPVCGAESDPEALELIARAYPGREVIAVPGAVLAFGGGGPHCITQQVPIRDDTDAQSDG
jgi:agmatine deiminase